MESNAMRTFPTSAPRKRPNFRLTGEAAIAPGWKAGYLMRIQDLSDNPMGLSQSTAKVDQGLNVQMSYWYVASKELGKLSVGRNALASKSAAMFTDLSGTQIIANYVLFDGGGFFMRRDGALLGLRWGDLGYCYSQARPWGGDCDGIVMQGVRYDSPTLAGFSVSASWGVDDDWEVAGRYSGEVAGFKIALGAGYSVNTDEQTQPPPVSPNKDSAFFQAGGYAEHVASGLFVHAAYGEENNSGKQTLAGFVEPNSHQWYLKGRRAGAVAFGRPHHPVRRMWTVLRPAIAQSPRGRRDGKRIHALRPRRRAGDRRRVHVGVDQVSRALGRGYRHWSRRFGRVPLRQHRSLDQLLAAAPGNFRRRPSRTNANCVVCSSALVGANFSFFGSGVGSCRTPRRPSRSIFIRLLQPVFLREQRVGWRPAH
jgi:Gram-negative porin